MRARRQAAFTLLEVLAVVLMLGLVLGIAMDFYIELSNASNRAAVHTRDIRRATAILDRVARDFERTLLLKKPDSVDPLVHPWLFYAESEYASEGSDHIKFVTRNHRPSRSASHESDLALVAYSVRQSEANDSLELWRWTSPRLPESLDRRFPRAGEVGDVLMAEELSEFAVRFIAEDGEPNETWDSTTLVDSGALPAAVEIEVAMFDPDADEFSEPKRYMRRVVLPVRPINLSELLGEEDGSSGGQDDGEGGEDEEDGEGSGSSANKKVQDCIDFAAAQAAAGGDPGLADLLDIADSIRSSPWQSISGMVPGQYQIYVKADCR